MLERGLDYKQIAFTQFVYYFGVFALEVPTGVIADKLGRKKSIILGCITKLFGVIAAIFSYSMWPFVLSEFCFAMARSLHSGACSALLYESIEPEKRNTLYKKYEGKAHGLHMLGLTTHAVLGAIVLLYYPLISIYIISAFFAFVALCLACTFKDSFTRVRRAKKKFTQSIQSLIAHCKESLHVLCSKKSILWHVVCFAVIFVLLRSTLVSLQQPFLLHLGYETFTFPLVDGVITLGAGLIALFAHFFEKKLGFYPIFFGLLAILCTSYFGMLQNIGKIAGIFLFLQMFVYGLYPPLMKDFLNREIQSSSIRATVLSLESLFSRGIFSLYAIFLGYMLDMYSLQLAIFATFCFGAGMTLVLALSFVFVKGETKT